MKFSYKFSNLLGAIYKKGNLLFTPDGNCVISPVGNRITIFDLKSNTCWTLPVESLYDYTALDISPNGNILVAVNERGEADVISLISQSVVHKYRFKRTVQTVKFSPDGLLFAACKEDKVFVFKAPGTVTGEAFYLERVFRAAHATTTHLEWSCDSQILAVCSKDMITKLYSLNKHSKFNIYSIGGHSDVPISCYFEANNYDLMTIGTGGQICFWECSINIGDLINSDPAKKSRKNEDSDDEEDDIDQNKTIEKLNKEEDIFEEEEEDSNTSKTKFYYKRISRRYIADEIRKECKEAVATCSAYHKPTKILIVGFSTGAFFIYDLPDLTLIHSLSMSEAKLTSISVNSAGDWITLGCSRLGQLIVWEWQSETYIMKQQAHSSAISSVCYSMNGQYLASGGEDGKVKLWNLLSGYCFMTFSEHTNVVSDVQFCGQKNFLVSSSLDGTVRAYDMVRYRNFRTFTTPRPAQFSSVATDQNGEFVAAGGQDIFEIYLWSVKTGNLLEALAGHEGPIAALAFNPTPASSMMASVSWDGTMRIWNSIEKGAEHEAVDLSADGLAIAFNPNGLDVAVSTLNGQISVFNLKTMEQIRCIEGRRDLGSGMTSTDLISARKTLESRAFTTICYSADGDYLLAGGQSRNVCIYNVAQMLLVRTFEISQNRSMEACSDHINRRKVNNDFGNKDLIERRNESDGGDVALNLPGTRKGDMSARVYSQQVRVFCLQFSPTGEQWAAATTEGLLVYSLSPSLVFDPWNLTEDITSDSIRTCMQNGDDSKALTMAIQLNESNLIQSCIECIPLNNVEVVISTLSDKHMSRLISFLGSLMESTNHLEFCLFWIEHVLSIHGEKIKALQPSNTTALLTIEKNLLQKYEQLAKICEFNKYTVKVLMDLSVQSSTDTTTDVSTMDKDEDDSDYSAMNV